jgi:E3 ubiquitin-protein ligase RNF14
LFEWTQFLKEEALKFLGIASSLDISQIYSRQIRNMERRQENQAPTNDQGIMTEPKTKHVRLKVEGPKREPMMPDPRAVLDLQSNEFAVTVLQKYSNDRKEAVFQKSNQSCNVCLSLKVGLDCIKFDQCGHTFCKSCIGGYFEVQIRDGNVQSLKCLEDKCDVSALPSHVRLRLTKQIAI